MEYNDREIKVYDGKVMPERAIQQPQNMMQIKSQFVAAMMVPVPRNEEKIIEKVTKIAEKRGHAFFYLWPVKNKDRVEIISGGTIDLAETLLYYWTNVAIEHDMQDIGNAWKIKHVFIDFERGLQVPRTTIVHKPKDTPTTWDKDRWERMCLNKANSFNLRDLIFQVVPRFMKDEIVEAAKVSEIKKAYVEFETGEAVNLFTALKVDYGLNKDDLKSFFGAEEITGKEYFKIKNLYAQLVRKDITSEAVLKGVSHVKKIETPAGKTDKPRAKKPKVDSSKKEPTTIEQPRPQEEEQPISEMQNMFKSLILRGISEMEICAYFYVENLDEIDESYHEGLSHVVTEIESERMTIDEFKVEAAERLTAKMEADKKK